MTESVIDTSSLIHGSCDPEFASVQEAFADNFRRRGEIGAAVNVYKDGKKVVDLWGGFKDVAKTHAPAGDQPLRRISSAGLVGWGQFGRRANKILVS